MAPLRLSLKVTNKTRAQTKSAIASRPPPLRFGDTQVSHATPRWAVIERNRSLTSPPCLGGCDI